MILICNNKFIKKYISIFIIIFIFFMSFFCSIALEESNKLVSSNSIDLMSDIDVTDISYELLILEDKIIQNRFKDRNLKISISDKLIMLFTFFGVNNNFKFIHNSILQNLLNTKLIHNKILLYIHAKDGKK